MSDTDDLTLIRQVLEEADVRYADDGDGYVDAMPEPHEEGLAALERIRQRLDATQDSVRQMDRLLKRHEDLNDQLQDSWNAERERAEQAEEQVRALTERHDADRIALVRETELRREAERDANWWKAAFHELRWCALHSMLETDRGQVALDRALSNPTATTEMP